MKERLKQLKFDALLEGLVNKLAPLQELVPALRTFVHTGT